MWHQLKKEAKKKLGKDLALSVDVDGTLLSYDYYEKHRFGKPRVDVVNKVREMKDRGVKIVLYTARNNDERQSFLSHLEEFGLDDIFDELIMGKKPTAFVYLDDRAVNCLDKGWEHKINSMLAKYITDE